MKNEHPTIAIVTPVFNKLEHTVVFLKSVKAQSYKQLQIYIVDDASTDNTAETVRSKFPHVTVIRNDKEALWWSGGTNLGVKQAIKGGADYILAINNDVEMTTGYIEKLSATAAKNPGALIGSMVRDQDNRSDVWYMGGLFKYKSGTMAHRHGRAQDYFEPLEADWLTGMGMLIPVEVFTKVGFFNNKDFPQYYGDAEFSIRAQQAGYKLVVDPSSVIYADVQSSWVIRWLKEAKLSFFGNLFFSRRSPYQFSTTRIFYKNFWPKGSYRWALLKMYTVGLRRVYIEYMRRMAKRILGRSHEAI